MLELFYTTKENITNKIKFAYYEVRKHLGSKEYHNVLTTPVDGFFTDPTSALLYLKTMSNFFNDEENTIGTSMIGGTVTFKRSGDNVFQLYVPENNAKSIKDHNALAEEAVKLYDDSISTSVFETGYKIPTGKENEYFIYFDKYLNSGRLTNHFALYVEVPENFEHKDLVKPEYILHQARRELKYSSQSYYKESLDKFADKVNGVKSSFRVNDENDNLIGFYEYEIVDEAYHPEFTVNDDILVTMRAKRGFRVKLGDFTPFK